ncbi:class I SAM-dependent methyltransferase [Aquibacillus koreensis]|uniref:Class I SAM-dependent methyltransferase n=1 Tax=Aquibacillus koreensis TaxID=279446 RepID=A0A9X3WKR0_9BACI|nr:class I SAM-dependent methyltransferase [Aquibacillus koreensis]MCT2537628.1 class I SAM-dependent methyltransferase [Aquibacillus koreensis]MDC3419074.1 class I SAM-dependent methyltransferase [Aquibacillus koreensis]
MSYAKMALVYDALMSDAPYDDWQAFADFIFKKYSTDISTVADLGCGTGQITRRLKKQGYQVFGVDYSEDMLAYAQQAATEEKLSIEWFKQDLRELNGFSNVDAAVSFCDVINYITDFDELRIVFKNVHQILKDKGLFLFDVHALEHVEQNLQDQTFAEVYDDLSYVWFCKSGENQGEVYHDLTFFELDNEMYERFDETHHQRTYSIPTYKRMLEETGFVVKGIFADFSTQTMREDESGERIFYVCEKNRGD